MNAIFEFARSEAPNIQTFYFKPERMPDYQPGQFTELTIPHDMPDDRGIKRWFTLSSSPTEELLAITTRILPDSSSFKQTLNSLKKGSPVHMAEPMGDFVLPADTTIPLVFLAAGIGITPFRSIFQWIHDTDESRSIRFIHAVKTEDDIIFQETLDAAGIHATIVVEDPTEAWGGERGNLSGEQLLRLAEPSHDSLIYLAGPEGFVETLQIKLLEQHIPREHLVLDFFPGYPSL